MAKVLLELKPNVTQSYMFFRYEEAASDISSRYIFSINKRIF